MNIRAKMKITILVFCICLFIISCNQKKEKKITNNIENQLPGKWREMGWVHDVTVSKEWSIGVAQGDETQEFYHPEDLAIDDEGNVYILDSGNFKIRVFDHMGKFKFQFGNQGMGPGEMSKNTFKIKFINKDTLLLVDGDLRRITFFTRNGKYLKFSTIPTFVDDAIPLDGSKLLYSNFILDENHNPIHIYDIINENIIQSFGKTIEPIKNIFALVKNTPEQFFFSYGGITSIAIDNKKNVYYLQEFPYLIIKYNRAGNKLLDFSRLTTFSTLSSVTLTKKGDDKIRWSLNDLSPQTGGIQIVHDSLVVSSIFSGDKNDNSVDFYNLQGVLLLSLGIPSQFDGSGTYIVSAKLDKDYNFYCLYNSRESFSKLDKFSINIKFKN